MRLSSYLLSAAAAVGFAALASSPAAAAGISFTWTPGAVGLAGSPITGADNFNVTDYATITVNQGTGAFSESGALNVTKFLSGGSTILSPGLGDPGGYSLFYVFSGTGNQGGPIPTTLGSTTTGSYDTLNYVLYGSTTPNPIFNLDGTSNAAGLIALATGSLVPGPGNTVSLTLTSGGLAPHADIEVTLNPCLTAGSGFNNACTGNESSFFTSPTSAVLQFGDFGATGTVVTTAGNQVFINGGGGNITEVAAPVPEPVTMSVFGAGLVGAVALRRRKAKKA